VKGNKHAKLETGKYLQTHPTGDAVIIPGWAYNSGIIFVNEVPKTRFNRTTRSPRKNTLFNYKKAVHNIIAKFSIFYSS
jgi:hypothetical protein